MGNDIGLGVLSKSIWFVFSTYVGSSVFGACTFNGFDVITH